MPMFSGEQVRLLLGFKPKTDFEKRLHLLILILLDTGCRITEALELRVEDVDLDNLLLTLHGKGRKDRKVPFSLPLRKALFKYLAGRTGRLFTTYGGTSWSRLSAYLSVKHHCRERLGFEPPPRTVHAMRHTAASNFVARGGSSFHLMRLLGHTTIAMSSRYVRLSTTDLAETHQRVSLLNA
jgi:integrase/recombinase XerD